MIFHYNGNSGLYFLNAMHLNILALISTFTFVFASTTNTQLAIEDDDDFFTYSGTLHPVDFSEEPAEQKDIPIVDQTRTLQRPIKRTLSTYIMDELVEFDLEQDVLFFDYDNTLFHMKEVKARSQKLIDLFNVYRKKQAAFIYTAGFMFPFYSSVIGVERYPHNEEHKGHLEHFIQKQPKAKFHEPLEVSRDMRNSYHHLRVDQYLYYFPEWDTFHVNWGHLKHLPIEPGCAAHSIKGDNLKSMIECVLHLRRDKPIRRIYFIDDLQEYIDPMTVAARELLLNGLIKEELKALHVPIDKTEY
jgi:hypothetical protein